MLPTVCEKTDVLGFEFDDILDKQAYVDRFRALCQLAVTSPTATYVFMERYAHINGFAGSGVALLAGNLGYERERFIDPDGESNPDRGMMIAAQVFTATIDEHGGASGRAPHRAMAQGCVEKVAEYAGLSQADRKRLDVKSDAFLLAVDCFKDNYAAADRTLHALVRSVGYHVASEYLADREYQILDEEVWHKNPDGAFRETVRRTRIDGKWGGPWAWITVHGHYGDAEHDDGHGVEEEHFQAALTAVRFLDRFGVAALAPEETHRLLVEGLSAFRDDFLAMFDAIEEEIGAAAAPTAVPALEAPAAA